MAIDLPPAQRQALVDGLNRLNRTQPIAGSTPILPPGWSPYPYTVQTVPAQLRGLPPAVQGAIAPNLGLNRGKGDFVTNARAPFPPVTTDPLLDINPHFRGDPWLEMQGRGIMPAPPVRTAI